jgi:hypothetical protein
VVPILYTLLLREWSQEEVEAERVTEAEIADRPEPVPTPVTVERSTTPDPVVAAPGPDAGLDGHGPVH